MSNPKFKVLKPVRWGVNQPGPDVVCLFEENIGDEMDHDDVTMDVATAMQKAGYVSIIDTDADADDIKVILKRMIEPISGKREQKTALEAYARENMDGYELDKSKSLEDCIEDLVAVHGEMNKD